jgi:large subunit ribosomal protein L7/L12
MKTNIKDIAKQISNLSQTEIDELGRILTTTYGMSATLYHYPIGIISTATGGSDQIEFDVFMRKTGDRKLMVLKTIKEQLGIGLKEAKDIVDSAPCVIIENTSKNNAEIIKDALEDAGATVEIH